jgi:Calcineurin-like phosphoesterase/Purple acid Phosphatase, N-terminal domain
MPPHTRLRRRIGLALIMLLPGVSAWSFAPAEAKDEPAAFLVLPYLQLPAPDGMTIMWETNRKLPGIVEYGRTKELGTTVEDAREKVLHEVRLPGLKPATTYHYRVRTGDLASEVFQFRTAPPFGTKRWRIALYGDSRSFPFRHKQVADGIRKAKVDMIVHTGDIVANGKDHDSWRKEFFDPLGELARSTPWVSTIGNHERDAADYFSYMAQPGNKHYFALDYGSAHIVCLDSNSWIEKGRDSKQGEWLVEHLAEKRAGTWTFVVFHHPLFSAHAARPIAPLRWDWAPLLLDPAHRVDAVLTGHDHFYARNYNMGRLAEKPTSGVLFMTSAGGGASLYRTRARDYVAQEKSAYHFVVLDCDGEEITLTAIDIQGKEIDRHVMTRKPTPPEEFCAYEIEEIRHFLRKALVTAAPIRLRQKGTTTIDTELVVPTRFQVPVSGMLEWDQPEGWKLKAQKVEFKLEPAQALKIPLQAEVAPGAFSRNPKLVIAFEPGRFRNRTIEVYPYQTAGPERVVAVAAEKAPVIDGQLNEEAWQAAEPFSLLGLPTRGGRGDQVRLLANKDCIYLGALLDDPAESVKVKVGANTSDGGRPVLSGEHVGLTLSNGGVTHQFAISPEQIRYHDVAGAEEKVIEWEALAGKGKFGWTVEMSVPRNLFEDWSKVRVNVTHRRRLNDKEHQELHLCPSYVPGNDPDRIPDIRPVEIVERLARLVMP